MAGLKLKTVTRTQGKNQTLKDGTVKPRSCWNGARKMR